MRRRRQTSPSASARSRTASPLPSQVCFVHHIPASAAAQLRRWMAAMPFPSAHLTVSPPSIHTHTNIHTTRPAGPRQYSRTVEKLRSICRAATITIAPTVYVKNKSDAEMQAALEALLDKHGLDVHSGARCRRRRAGGGACAAGLGWVGGDGDWRQGAV